jgi:hypothetical protein
MTWAPDYVTTDELRDYLDFQGAGNRDEDQIEMAIATASRAADKETNRQFGLVGSAEARIYRAQCDSGNARWFAMIDDLMTVTGLAVATDPLGDDSFSGDVATHYRLLERNAAQKGRPWTRLDILSASSYQPARPDLAVKVTARWGWTEVPRAVVQAVTLQAARLLWRRDSPAGVAGSPDAGSEVRLLAKLDPDVRTSLRPYRRMWGAVGPGQV